MIRSLHKEMRQSGGQIEYSVAKALVRGTETPTNGVHEFRSLPGYLVYLSKIKNIELMAFMLQVEKDLKKGNMSRDPHWIDIRHKVLQFKRDGVFTPEPYPTVLKDKWNHHQTGRHRIAWMLSHGLPCNVKLVSRGGSC